MARKSINLGAQANDNSGTDLRTGGGYINDNFIELYSIAYAGVCNGTRHIEFCAGIKYAWLTPVNYNQLYYISKIVAGTPYTGNKLTYTVEIRKTTLAGTAGTLVGEKTYHVDNTSPKTGLESHAIASAGTGGITGFLVIDWSRFQRGETYVCDLWEEGSLYAINTASAQTSTGGGGIEPNPIIQIDAPQTVNGSEPIYKINPDEDKMRISLDSIVSIEGPVTLKNIHDSYSFSVDQADGLKIDDHSVILVAPRSSITILADVTEFIVSAGSYSVEEA